MLRNRVVLTLLSLVAAVTLGVGLHGCSANSCLKGSADCSMKSPCEGLSFSCDDEAVTIQEFASGDPIPAGLNALASPGDFVLENSLVTAVIDALGSPHYISPSGGTLIDLAPKGGADSLNQIAHATGLLPGDAANYTDFKMIEGDGFVALQVVGTLDGHPDLRIATRYELRACEPGIRVRTEVVNLETEAKIWSVLDGFYWSGRESLPFTPVVGAGTGFEHPGFGLTTVGDAYRKPPFMVATAHTDEASSYAVIACNYDALSGFQSDVISALGSPRRVIPPGEFEVYERFIGVVPGRDVAPAAAVAFDVRAQLFDEKSVRVSGTVVSLAGKLGEDEAQVSVRISEGGTSTALEDRTPWNQSGVAADGTFSFRVPGGATYLIEVDRFGRKVFEKQIDIGSTDLDVGTLEVEGSADLTFIVTRDGLPVDALVFVHPADESNRTKVTGRLHGAFMQCAPLLGSPHGGTPACNRVLVRNTDTVQVPPGSYDVYATSGPFSTIARASVTLAAGDAQVISLGMQALPLQPAGTLTGDFHVHGGQSFDSSIPDTDRVLAWLAADIDVIVSTDHDVVWDYADAVAQLGATNRLEVLVGVETTGHVLWKLDPTTYIPKVIGHWIFWPLPFVEDHPRRGTPDDERVEPAMLFQRLKEEGWPDDTGVAQLNHPWAEADFGRDLGWPRAVGVNTAIALPTRFDETDASSLMLRSPEGTDFDNMDYHAQEVMNGTKNGDFLEYRAYWFYLLNQGIVRAGTANSDSHGLTDNVLGTPRTFVWTPTTVGAGFDHVAFDAAVREGRMMGTNGPIIEISTVDGAGVRHTPSVNAFVPASTAQLSIRVTAAPWVPVTEIRVIVNGKVAQTLEGADLLQPADPFGTGGTTRYDGTIDLAALLPSDGRDSWVVVEAGTALPVAGDLDCNGIPDTTDNNGDGTIDWKDVERDGEDGVTEADQDVDENGVVDAKDEPEACEGGFGPIQNVPVPTDRDDPLHLFEAVTPGGYPLAFTNPLILDRDGGGFSGPGVGAN